MLSPKTFFFCKRSIILLSPLPLFTYGARIFNDGGNNSYSITLGKSRKAYGDGSAIALANKINKKRGRGIVDRGSILVLDDFSIEQMNPFNENFFGFGGEYWYKKAKIKEPTPISNGPSEEIYFEEETTHDGHKKYSLSLEKFQNSTINGKGDLHLVSEISIKIGKKEIPISTMISLQDLIYENDKEHEIFLISKENDSSQYNFQISKENNSKRVEFKVKKKTDDARRSRRSTSFSFDESNIEVKSFYFIFTTNPPLDFTKIFFQTDESDLVGNDSSDYSVRRQIHLANWSNGGSSGAKYTLDTTKDFWKSICRDPYKIGGWIDEDLTKKQEKAAEKQTKKSTETTHIKRQMDSWEEFKVGFNVKPKQTQQYYWEQEPYNKPPHNIFMPSSDYTTSSPCEGMDEETKKLYGEFIDLNKELPNEPDEYSRITLKPQIDVDDKNSNKQYPFQKIIQSSFRAWGNGISKKGNPMHENIYSPLFEESLQTEHSFSLKIEKQVVIEQLIEHEKLLKERKISKTENKKLNELPQVSSLLKINVPFSYAVYDPLGNYYRKNRILLTIDLDMRNIYNQSSSTKTIFTQNLKNSHGLIGHDYGIDGTEKNSPYGINGILEFSSTLHHDLDGNVFVDVISKTKGFVNTKNTDCDLRHRIFKWKGEGQKCFESSGKYRKHNHIPSFLIISLEKDPTVSSFFVDRSSTIADLKISNGQNASVNLVSQQKTKEITTLSDFKGKIEGPEDVKKTFIPDKSENGEVYFDDFASYLPDSGKFDVEKNDVIDSGFLWSNYYDKIYYYKPRKNTNSMSLGDDNNLSSVVLMLGGADSLASNFFRSGHFSTMMTLCYSNGVVNNSSQNTKECGDGIKYEKITEDKRSSELLVEEGSQRIEIDWSEIKDKNKDSPLTIDFRALIHSQLDEKNKFTTNREKYEKVFKKDAQDITKDNRNNIPDFSFVGVWYTMQMWYDQSSKALFYSTMVRPISHVPEPIGNDKNYKSIGALGSAGFQVRSMEFIYRKK